MINSTLQEKIGQINQEQTERAEAKATIAPAMSSPAPIVNRAEILPPWRRGCGISDQDKKYDEETRMQLAEAKAEVEAKDAAESSRDRRTRWEAEIARYKEVKAEFDAALTVKVKRLLELHDRCKEAPSQEMEDEYRRTYKECLHLQEQWSKEERRRHHAAEVALRGPLFHNGKPDSLRDLIKFQIAWEEAMEDNKLPHFKSGFQQMIEGSKEPLDDVVLDRLCVLQEAWNEINA